jgi:crossover junction endodeoxyribonuclease RuvC
MYVLGIDPGLVNTGICVLHYENNIFHLIFSHDIKTSSKSSLRERLYDIYQNIENICLKFPQVTILGLEESYVNMNAKSSLKLGMVVGIILVLSAKYKYKLQFMSATHVKKHITGNGHSSKELMCIFVHSMLVVPRNLSTHIYDAIAIGILAVEN